MRTIDGYLDAVGMTSVPLTLYLAFGPYTLLAEVFAEIFIIFLLVLVLVPVLKVTRAVTFSWKHYLISLALVFVCACSGLNHIPI